MHNRDRAAPVALTREAPVAQAELGDAFAPALGLGLVDGHGDGLFARRDIKACKMLIDLHNSTVPDNREALEALPGVGRKTANVVLNTAFGQPTMAVDTHIFRVANLTKIAPGKKVLEVEKQLLKFIPKPFLIDAHHWMILHGRYVCTARKPKCGSCIIEDLCEFKEKTEPSG